MFTKPKVYLLSLGCPKNLVDSELILGKLQAKKFVIADQPKEVDLAIINTCAFIQEAKEESIEAILDLVELKKEGQIKKLCVVGCLPQRYVNELKEELKEVDGFLGVEGWRNLDDLLREVSIDTVRRYAQIKICGHPRFRLTPRHYAYIKIAEGCDNFCSYCSISKIRGRLRSRPMEEIKKEVVDLAEEGSLKEINLVGQDTALYGLDLYGRPQLISLLKELEKIKTIEWLRLLYTHPAHFSLELIKFIADSRKVCHYIDLPLQHISDKILKRMGRKISQKEIYQLISSIRKSIKPVALRTAFIVGFPGETDRDFKELIDFIKEIKFEHLGAFIYSREEGTPAYDFLPQVSKEIKEERYNHLLEVQKAISEKILKGYLSKILPILVDEKLPEDDSTFLARTEFEAPEVDGTVIIKDRSLKVGSFFQAKITGTWEYDLLAEKIKQYKNESAQ